VSKIRRDSQKSKVYRAERLAWSVYDQPTTQPISLHECQKIANAVSRTLKLREPIAVIAIGGRSWWRSARANEIWGCRTIKLPQWAQTKVVVCHELAHHVAGLSHGHNGRFVSSFIQLTRRFIGPVEADILKLAFKEAHVKTKRCITVGVMR
jgi:putative metallohydrolase (TIGR04338 family)